MKICSGMLSNRQRPLIALIAAVLVASIAQGPPKIEAQHQTLSRFSPSSYLNDLPLLADFDGDRRLDLAQLHSAGTHHCVRVRFGDTRDIHLEFGSSTHLNGVLLVRDVNRDNRPDLIWVYHSRWEQAVVWLNDGAGRFAKSSKTSVDTDSLFGDRDYAVTGRLEGEQVCLVAARPQSEFAQATNFDPGYVKAVLIERLDLRRDLGLYLSYLRQRGPPEIA